MALCLGAGVYGSSLGQHVTQSGFFDEGSESAQASRLGDEHYGRDTSGHIVAIYTAPEGKTVDDPAFRKKILANLAQVEEDHPDEIIRSIGYFKTPARAAQHGRRVEAARVHVDPAQGRQRRPHPEELQSRSRASWPTPASM